MGAGELADGELTPDEADAFGRAVAELSLAVAMSRDAGLTLARASRFRELRLHS